MLRRRSGGLLAFLVLAVAASAGLTLRAQVSGDSKRGDDARETPAAGSIQDALVKPYAFHFGKPTPLNEVIRELGKTLKVPVVLDRAAANRMELDIDDGIQLELEGVRLQTGLKLMLDQLGLTYRVVPEDNLLIITDAIGATDPMNLILSELQALRRDLREAQDGIDEIREALGIDDEAGARVRKPTIIEEMPAAGEDAEKPKARDNPPASTPSRSRPGA